MSGKPVEPLPSGSDAAFRALFEQEVVGVGQADTNGRIVSANARLAHMLGYAPGELLGLTFDDITHPDSRQESSSKLAFLIGGGGGFVIEKQLVRQDGDSIWGVANVTAVRDENGGVSSLLAFIVDVTERKRAERSSAFLAGLSARLGSAREEKEIVRTSLQALCDLLHVQRAYFAECNEAESRVQVSGQRGLDPAGSFSQSFSLHQLGGAAWWRNYSRGDLAVEDAQGDAMLPLDLGGASARSYATQTLERKGGWRVTLSVVDDVRRVFRRDELLVLSDLLARVWPLVERARTEAALTAELKAVEGLLVERHQSDTQRRAADDLAQRVSAESDRRHRLYETIFSGTPDLIYVFDLQRRFVYANTALLDTWGRSLREVIGGTCLEIGYPDWQAAMHDSEIDQVVATKRSIRGEVPFKGPQGERIHDYIFVPVIGADGEVEAIAGTTRDVTVLKQAEHLMAGQAQALELMVKGAPLPEVLEALCDVIDRQATSRLRTSILLMDDEGRHLRPAAGRHMPAAWSRAVDPWPVGPESGACGTAAYRRQPVITPDIMQDPLWSGLKDLAARHGLRACWSTPIFSSGGTVLGTLAMYYPRVHQPDAIERRLVDVITRTAGVAIERKRGEEGLKTHSERLRLLWEAASVLLTTDEPEALVRVLFGRIAPHLELDVVLNYAVEEGGTALRLFFSEGIEPERAEALTHITVDSALVGDVTRTHEPFSLSYLQSSQDPRHAPIKAMGLQSYACFPLNADERVLGTLSVGSRSKGELEVDELEFLRTVTRYMTVAYERLRLVRELRDADRKKDDFIALLAHELRNPLAPLRNGLHVMRLAAHDSAAVARARAIMERQLSHMVRLIDDLLDISRISLNKLQLRRSRVSLSEIVSSAVETARPVIDGAEHHLEVLLPSEPLMLDADLTRLAQVLGNLLANAAKFTPKSGRITLRAERQGDAVVVAVEDTGIGLRPESLRAIFDMFSQVDHSVERTSGGLGIGLALVRGLTEMHGGSVRAESAGPGQGSRFIVRLPIVALPEEEATQSLRAASPDSPRRRILVADDNRDAVESLATMLRLSGNEVHTAGDGIEAVELAESLAPDVVLMDIGMPRLNGREATRRIRSQEWGKRMVVIALTGWGQDSDRRLSREAGCDDHLVKPVDLAELERLMRELCGPKSEHAPREPSSQALGEQGLTASESS
jgi:PAS domain S-box-containing protein